MKKNDSRFLAQFWRLSRSNDWDLVGEGGRWWGGMGRVGRREAVVRVRIKLEMPLAVHVSFLSLCQTRPVVFCHIAYRFSHTLPLVF